MFFSTKTYLNQARLAFIMSKRMTVLLIVLFLLVLFTRLYIAYSIPGFSSGESYFNLRQVEHIVDTGKPLFYDDLSFSGRTHFFSPVFHYFVAFFGLFLPVIFAAKLLTNLFAASLLFFVYLISKKITNNSFVAFFTAFLAGFVPVFFADTVTELNPVSIAVPLIFLLVYALMNVQEKKWLYCYLVLLFLLTFLHPIILLFVLGLFIYLALILIEHLRQKKEELEIALFSIFFVLWGHFIFYKKLLIFHGPAVIWQNIPQELLNNYFSQMHILEAIYNIGIVPFVFGLYIIYLFSFKRKKRDIYLIIAFAASAGLLLWLKLIQLHTGLIFLGITLVLLFSQWLEQFISRVKESRLSNFVYLFVGLIFAAVLLFSVYPSIAMAKQSMDAVSSAELDSFKWIKSNTPADSVIVASPEAGHFITALAGRKNVLDTDFLLRADAKQRYADVKRIYAAYLEIEVVGLMNKYDADFIYFSDDEKNLFNTDTLHYVEKCFDKVYDKDIQIYERTGCASRVVE